MTEEAPYCADCIHLLGKRPYRELADQWKCVYKENVLDITRDLVTGAVVYVFQFPTCYATREDARGCGREGKWFEKYTPLQANPRGLNLGKSSRPTADAESLLAELGGFHE